MDQAAGGGVVTRCTDCTAVVHDNELKHDETCPIGRALDTMTDNDRAYFEEHPDQTEYVRPFVPFEFPPEVLDPVPFGYQRMVIVRKLGEGLRARQPFIVRVLR